MNISINRRLARSLATTALASSVALGSLVSLPLSPAVYAAETPNLSVTVAQHAPVEAGDTFTLGVTVRNLANTATAGTSGIRLRVQLDGAHFVQHTTPAADRENFDCSGTHLGDAEITCQNGLLQGGGRANLTFKLKAPADPQTLDVKATVTPQSGAQDPNSANNTQTRQIEVFVRPDVTITSLDGAEGIGSFASEDYRFTVKNLGRGQANDVLLDLQGQFDSAAHFLPLDFKSVDIVSSDHQGFSCRVLRELAATGGAQVRCTGGSLRQGEQVTIRVRAATTLVVGSGSARLTAKATVLGTPSEEATSNNSRSLTIRWN